MQETLNSEEKEVSNLFLSESMTKLLELLDNDDEFKKLKYYLRSLKKAPHGGVFNNINQKAFLSYNQIVTHMFFQKDKIVPYPVQLCVVKLKMHIAESRVSIEELLILCFCVDDENKNDLIFGELLYDVKIYSAMVSGVLTLKNPDTSSSYEEMLMNAISGKIKFLDYFNCNYSRLLEVFLLIWAHFNKPMFSTINDIERLEKLNNSCDKYGLSDVTTALFDRQGFSIDNKYYLYNIFFDTSIGNTLGEYPLTIDIIKSETKANIFMRCDDTLAVPLDKRVTTATTDMQKWRGLTLNLGNIEKQIEHNKEVTVHWDDKTGNKVLVIVKPSKSETNELYYHISVEELWSPNSIYDHEETVITNFIHGCYYPRKNTFDHIDFSVNQYNKSVFQEKYKDSEATTSISIEQYANTHYKVWCVKGVDLSLQVWAKLVNATLDQPFRNLFNEIIGAETEEG